MSYQHLIHHQSIGGLRTGTSETSQGTDLGVTVLQYTGMLTGITHIDELALLFGKAVCQPQRGLSPNVARRAVSACKTTESA